VRLACPRVARAKDVRHERKDAAAVAVPVNLTQANFRFARMARAPTKMTPAATNIKKPGGTAGAGAEATTRLNARVHRRAFGASLARPVFRRGAVV
jgi:hypothetical protein